jgi:transmembrane sensor
MEISKNLLDRYHNGTATEEEKALVEAWYNQFKLEREELSFETLKDEQNEGLKRLNGAISKRKVVMLWKRASVAACLLLGILTLFFIKSDDADRIQVRKSAPATEFNNVPLLTLSDGTKINLSGEGIGDIVEEQGVKISKGPDGSLVYTVSAKAKKTEEAWNTIETPIGSIYQVNLPDGSKVWLNAMSKLRYPVQFDKKTARSIELEGEAYFEVAQIIVNKETKEKQAFLVKSNGQIVHVLGTHFNISAYQKERAVETTLLEGVVKVESKKSNIILSPGQQSSTDTYTQNIEVKEVNIEDEMAWKNGYFHFENESIVHVMEELSRWYNIEVEYRAGVSNQKIGGTFSKSKNIKELLGSLEALGGLRFKIEGRSVIVMP